MTGDFTPAKEIAKLTGHGVQKRAKLEKDTAYQQRKAAERGARIQTSTRGGSLAANISTSPVELAKRPDPPEDSSAAYLTRWDSWIRLANFGELALAIFTLIFIRIRSSLTNSLVDDEFPADLDIEKRSETRRGKFTQKKDSRKTHESSTFEGLKPLRDELKDISFCLHKRSFKSYVKDDAVWIRMMKANRGTQETVSSAKAKLSILTDAVSMPRDQFRGRLETFLRKAGFEI